MGLDMYAFTIPADLATRETDLDLGKLPGVEQLHYWRKHPHLHGWMEQLYFAKGGQEDVFNTASVELTLEDLDGLETAIVDDELPETCGFFFGVSDGTEREDDLSFIAKARAAIAEGKAVYYDSWW